MIDFSEADIRRAVSSNSYNRGAAYQRQNRVRDLKTEVLSNGEELIMARVTGSGRNVYSAHITLRYSKQGQVSVLGECSCPVAYQCKHVVATLLQALQERKPVQIRKVPKTRQNPFEDIIGNFEDDLLTELFGNKIQTLLGKQSRTSPSPGDSGNQNGLQALNQWLMQLERIKTDTAAFTSIKPAVYKPAFHALYFLNIEKNTIPPRVIVTAVSARLLKAGGYGKFTPLSSHEAAYLTSLDKTILKWLDITKQRFYGYSGEYPLAPQDTAEILKLLLKSGRCRWQNKESTPLTLGEPREVKPAWLFNHDGSQKAGFEGAENLIILPAYPLWYINSKDNTCGPLQTGLADSMGIALLSAPKLQPEQVESARLRLQSLMPDLPQPQKLSVSRQIKATPVPSLYLYLSEQHLNHYSTLLYGADTTEIPLIRLSFDYDDNKVHGYLDKSPQLTHYDAEKRQLVEISRNRIIEQNARRHLQNQGLESLREHPLMSLLGDVPEEESYDLHFSENKKLTEAAADKRWMDFSLFEVPRLRAAGWQVEMSDNYPYRVVDERLIDDWYADVEESSGIDWFGFELGIHVDGERMNLLPLLVDMLGNLSNIDALAYFKDMPDDTLVTPRLKDGRLLPLPLGRVRSILETLIELFDQEPLDEEGRLRLQSLRAAQLAELEQAMQTVNMRWMGGERLLKLGRRLRDFSGIKESPLPEGFQTDLRPYQQEGLNWLQFLREYELAGILADDMGLGKTVQTLAHLLTEKRAGRMQKPSLVIAPTSLMANWRLEARRFAPDLKVLTLHGPERKEDFAKIPACDVILSTYPLLPRDKDFLLEYHYHLLILDEAQNIKNPKAKVTQVAHQLKADHRLCLTGTPMENHLGELWSLCHFLMPGLLGDQQNFRQLFRTPIEKEGNTYRSQALARRLKPFMLRRTKEAVVLELPEKNEIIRTVELGGAQRDLYETIRLTMHSKVRKEVEKKGMARSQIIILDALLKLRQVCCDPRLLKLEAAQKVKYSAKLELLMNLLPEMIEEGRRVLLFSQFTGMLRLIEQEVKKHKLNYLKLTGQSQKRGELVERFQNGEAPLFLISLKAGGTGLNLTAADTVIHYDPWWNPAVENQATDRAHRIGQDKKVFVYKLLTEGTVEEKIQEMQVRKKQVANALFSGVSKGKSQLSGKDLEALFEPLG